jgi:glutamate synthase (ferredoxin)
MTIRGLFEFNNLDPISIDRSRTLDRDRKKFKTGAMSLGSLSQEAHENLAIVQVNRIKVICERCDPKLPKKK